MLNKILPMTGVEPRTSGIKSNRSTNWATTTACFVIVAKSKQHLNSPTFPFLADTKLCLHDIYGSPQVNLSQLFVFAIQTDPGANSIKLYGSVNYGFVVTAKFWP